VKWTDAAEQILRQEGTALDYRSLAKRIVDRDLVKTDTQTPHITLHVSISSENRRRGAKGLPPRFLLRRGEVALTEWDVGPLEDAFKTLSQLREKTKRDLLKKLRELSGTGFEGFLEVLFTEMGYSVTVTAGSEDEGVDLVAELEGGVGIQRVGIQGKCLNTKRSVGPNTVRLLRDALSVYKCNAGAVVTTTTFDPKAVEVAAEDGKLPIVLVDCNALVDLAMEHQVGIRQESLPVYFEDLDEVFSDADETV
jgi:restriction endonuclease Mrr